MKVLDYLSEYISVLDSLYEKTEDKKNPSATKETLIADNNIIDSDPISVTMGPGEGSLSVNPPIISPVVVTDDARPDVTMGVGEGGLPVNPPIISPVVVTDDARPDVATDQTDAGNMLHDILSHHDDIDDLLINFIGKPSSEVAPPTVNETDASTSYSDGVSIEDMIPSDGSETIF